MKAKLSFATDAVFNSVRSRIIYEHERSYQQFMSTTLRLLNLKNCIYF